MIVDAMRCLNLPHLTFNPIFQALIMNQLDASSALTNVKQRITLLASSIEAKPADLFIA
jgi:hypothetical protein